MPLRCRNSLILLGLLTAWPLRAELTLPRVSPFLPPSAATAAEEAVPFEFTGVAVVGRSTMVAVLNRRTHRANWLVVGRPPEDGLSAKSYDPKGERIRLEVLGSDGKPEVLLLVLRKAGRNAPAPILSSTAEKTAKDETEARMLVSDLLEIGIAQRKAYEEAHRKTTDQGAPAR